MCIKCYTKFYIITKGVIDDGDDDNTLKTNIDIMICC